MRKFTKIKAVLLTLGMIFGFSIPFNTNFSNNWRYNFRNLKGDTEPKLKSSGHWEIGPIYIEDDDPSYTWAITEATQDWCNLIDGIYVIENVTIDGLNSDSCIEIQDSSVDFIIRNCTLSNSKDNSNNAGIDLYRVNKGIIINNSIMDNNFQGIILYDSSNNTISNNTIYNSGANGISIYNYQREVEANSILNNKIYNNGLEGILIWTDNPYTSQFHTIKENRIYLNGENGIHFFSFSGPILYNTVSNNIIYNNTQNGIRSIAGTDYITISNNSIENNTQDGMALYRGSHFTIKNNNISNNNNGLMIDGSSGSESTYNIVVNNTFKDNILYGLYINEYGRNNDIYINNFTGNTIHGYDLGTSNDWDIGLVGNYWDDYGGVDANDDGIGESPYDVPPAGGSVDYLPIAEDGAPQITINSPSNGDAFSTTAPNFSVTITDDYLDIKWYTLDGGLHNYTFTENGIINQSVWDGIDDGTITLTFYARDIPGNIGSAHVNIIKDTVAPVIIINSPTPNQLCGIAVPSFSLTIDEPNLHEKWYSLNDGQNITFTTETQFNQSEWNEIGNGTVIIKFYAIDKAGNLNSNQVIVRKDAILPFIKIIFPIQNEIFRSTSPVFNISIIEENLVSTWYTLEGVAGTFSFTGLNGSISQDAWTDTLEGEITITFYALDKAGNIGTESVPVIKSIPSQPTIPGYNVFLLFGIISVISVIIVRKLKCSKNS